MGPPEDDELPYAEAHGTQGEGADGDEDELFRVREGVSLQEGRGEVRDRPRD